MTEDPGKPYVIREVTDPWKMRELEDVQVAAWGYADREVLPATIFRISAVTGGIVLAAYDAREEKEGSGNNPAIGLAYGFPAWVNGELWHHSHLLASRPEWRGTGLAVAMKLAQRERALSQGITKMTWTFDPLVARNARLNLGKLGARAVSYHPDWYALGDSPETAFPADRLMIQWDLTRPSKERPAPEPQGTFLLRAGEQGEPVPTPVPDGHSVLLAEVPTWETQGAKRLAWRLALREVLGCALERSYVITDLARHGEHAYYVLTTPE